jgi:hypothetical protein
MTFTYKLTGKGWAAGKLEIDKQLLEFEVSYLCDPLADLLEGLVEITPGYATTNFNEDVSDNEMTFIWQGEPWGYKWLLKFNSFDSLVIQVITISDIYDEADEGQICINSTCNYFDFVSTVIEELTLLLKKHGLVGYHETWAGKADFPISNFLKLKHFIKTKKALEIMSVETLNPEDKYNRTEVTIINDELKLLTENL